jgi:hypothetical protein
MAHCMCQATAGPSWQHTWLHGIEDRKPCGALVNKTPAQPASLAREITKANLVWGGAA